MKSVDTFATTRLLPKQNS